MGEGSRALVIREIETKATPVRMAKIDMTNGRSCR